jgi:CRP/FNR family cyclic AMP-dependent transcriptional regulator
MSETVKIRGADGVEYAYTLNRVLDGLVAALSSGQIDAAVALYAQIREDIAFQLIGRTQGNRPVFQQVANLFFQARDYQRAAYCCEQLDEPQKAAELYERADDAAAAAQMYAAAGNVPKAAEMFERAGSHVEAAKLHLHLGGEDHIVRAAMCFEKANRPFEAASAWEQAGRIENALGQYQNVADDSPDKKHADKQVRAIEERLGLRRSTTGQIPLSAVQQAPERFMPATTLTTMEGFDALRRIPLFAELSLPELKAIHHLCVAIDVPAGARLVEAGQPSPALWILLGVTAEVRGGHTTVARIEPGDHVGDMGLFDDSPAEVDVVALSSGRCLRLDKPAFRDAMAASDAFALRIHRGLFRSLRDRLRHTTRLVTGGVA